MWKNIDFVSATGVDLEALESASLLKRMEDFSPNSTYQELVLQCHVFDVGKAFDGIYGVGIMDLWEDDAEDSIIGGVADLCFC